MLFRVRIDDWLGLGGTYWLRSTVWTSELDRANIFENEDEAKAALEKARKFNPKAAKAAKVVSG